MAWTEKYVTTSGTEAWATNSSSAPSSLAEAIANVAAGQRVNIQAGEYAQTTTSLTFSTAGTTSAPIWWRGYKTVIGDRDTSADSTASTDIPLISFSTGQLVISGGYQIFSSLAVTSACTTTGGAVSVSGTYVDVHRTQITNSANNTAARSITLSGSGSKICLSKLTAHAGADTVATLSGGNNVMLGCSLHGGTDGVNSSNSGSLVIYNIFDDQADDAMRSGSGPAYFVGNSVYSPAGHGYVATAAHGCVLINNYFESVNQAAKVAITQTSGTDELRFFLAGNSFYDCTDTIAGIPEDYSIYGGTLASAAFTAPASDNFTPAKVSRSLAVPAAMEGLSLSVGYAHPGALQPLPDLPSATNVTTDDTVDGVTGTFTVPATTDVKSGTQYGAGGTEFTGTLSASGGGACPVIQAG